MGVYISRVEEGSVAERAGLRPGDSILQVNGTPFTAISHDEALKVCQIYNIMSIDIATQVQVIIQISMMYFSHKSYE